MNRIKLFCIFFFIFTVSLNAQNVYKVNSPFNSIRQNGVSNLIAAGDTVWISPALNYNVGNSIEWFLPADIDSITESSGRIFSMDITGSRFAVGLGFNSQLAGESIPTGFGFYVSSNSGINWGFREFPIDDQPIDNCDDQSIPYTGECDIIFTYGGEQYSRIRNTVPQQSPPYDIQVKGNTIFTAVWASGLLRSTDSGLNWEKIILPPSDVRLFNPNNTYSWRSDYQNTSINRYDSRSDFNLLGFGLHLDSNNSVWYGSANGVNISEDAFSAPTDSIIWKHVNFNNSSNGLLGNWVIEIEEDPNTNRIWMTNWIIDAQTGEQFGLVATSDNGENFQQYLIGEKINSIGFKDGAIIAAGENGLFISKNNGSSWSKYPQIRSANTFLKEGVEFFAVSASNDRLWIGTDDGVISTNDLGESWEINRVDFPLSGGNVFEENAKTVNTYAYPNPFSPTLHEVIRIKYELKKSGNVKIQIFDFGMNLVRQIEDNTYTEGTYEAVWDGVDKSGRNVANGPYIYVIEMSDRTIDGKILLIE